MADPEFSEQPTAVWLTEQGPDRAMRLLADFWFKDRSGKTWAANEGDRIDGASIPQPLWSLVGSPYTGDYRRASIVHDIACVAAQQNESLRRAADRMFYEACRQGGCSVRESIILYVGVRIGAYWRQRGMLGKIETKLRDDEGEEARRQLRAVAERTLAQNPPDEAVAVELATDQAKAALIDQLASLADGPPLMML